MRVVDKRTYRGAIIEKYRKKISKITNIDQEEINFSENWNEGDRGFFIHTDEINEIAHFWIKQMPGCCGMCVSTAAFVSNEYRKKGLGTLLNKLRIDLSKEFGYGLMICTDVDHNEPQKRILKKNKWTHMAQFVSPKTANTINIHAISLEDTNWTEMCKSVKSANWKNILFVLILAACLGAAFGGLSIVI